MARSRSGTRGRRGPKKPRKWAEGTESAVRVADPATRGAVEIPDSITVKELAELIGINSADVIRELIRSGIFATINQTIDRDTAALVTEELGFQVSEVRPAEAREAAAEAAPAPATKVSLYEEDEPDQLVERAPIVTVMGHVDHGKTSLLDRIRESTVAAGERGGITQRIGASEAIHGGRRIVFLDTPGHEAFTSMRARGARVTDIAVLVVAADDGVMPQTVEAIDHARAAGVPIIVALNKIDLPDSKPDRIKTELSERGVVIEEYGGDVPLVPVSAKTRQGIDDLLETILLTSDATVEPKANPDRPAVGTIVEAELDRARGPVASVLIQTGTLRQGDAVVVGNTYGRARALEDSTGKRISKSGPASAVVLLGLADVPEAGDVLRVVESEKVARVLVEERLAATVSKSEATGHTTLEDLYRQVQAGQTKELRIVLKSDVQGSLGAVVHALEQVQTDEVRFNFLLQGTGDITDNDVNLAAASDAVVVGFNVRVAGTARKGAESEGVEIRLYDIIYKLTEDMEAALAGMLEPEIVETIQGRAEVRQVFRVGRGQAIAGSYVTDGRIVRGGARVYRNGQLIATDRVSSVRRFKDDVREVATGYECGIALTGFHTFEELDVIESFTTETIARAVTR
ncbi:MAG TPA: translation initiation factor IF-2 [Candidatus Deferrimicrobium sp.]|nr:translation initiation factor IF-2 [Candidatus Deferrimicrobium sp.]